MFQSTARRVGDAKYRKARIRSRGQEPCPPPPIEDAKEEAQLRAVWQTEWFGFPAWELVLLARAAVGPRRWHQLGSNDRRRAACERFTLCGPWVSGDEGRAG